MALYRRGRIWYADFYNGKARLQVSTGTANKGKAEKFLALRISEVERGEYSKPTRITLAELGRQYMDYAKATSARGSGMSRFWSILYGAFGNLLLPNITALPIERYKLVRNASGEPGNGQP
jgi:hypothetical protein